MEAGPSSTDETQVQPRTSGWLFPALLLVVALGVAIFGYANRPTVDDSSDSTPIENWTPAPQPTGETVQLVIDFGNGARREFDALPWSPGTTVADVMEAARSFHPGIRYTQQNSGESGFLTMLEGVENEGTGGRYWRFSVDGEVGKSSYCIAQVEPGSSILWEFTAEY